MITKKLVLELIEERIAEINDGLFVVELKISSTNIIRVELDKHVGGVTVEDCVRVSRNVEHNLDREEQDFELHVSSAGLDKPLRVLGQYVKNVGREVEVLLNDGTELNGTLTAADENTITVQTSSKEKIEGKKKKELVVQDHVLPMNTIKETKIVISFK